MHRKTKIYEPNQPHTKENTKYIYLFPSLPRALSRAFHIPIELIDFILNSLYFDFVMPTICSIDSISRCTETHLLIANVIQLLVNINLVFFLYLSVFLCHSFRIELRLSKCDPFIKTSNIPIFGSRKINE